MIIMILHQTWIIGQCSQLQCISLSFFPRLAAAEMEAEEGTGESLPNSTHPAYVSFLKGQGIFQVVPPHSQALVMDLFSSPAACRTNPVCYPSPGVDWPAPGVQGVLVPMYPTPGPGF